MSLKKKRRELEGDGPAEERSEPGQPADTPPPDPERAAEPEMSDSAPQHAPAPQEPAGASPDDQAAAVSERESQEDEVPELSRRVAELESEVEELRDQLLRRQADFENSRKRLARDKEESVRYANTALLADLIEVIDGFERAIRSSEESRDFDAFHQGIVLIEKQLVSNLEQRWGLARIRALSGPFDPEVHQAISVEERADVEPQVVLEEYQTGYRIHDRVLRPAKVKVSVAPTSGDATESGGTAGEDAQSDETAENA